MIFYFKNYVEICFQSAHFVLISVDSLHHITKWNVRRIPFMNTAIQAGATRGQTQERWIDTISVESIVLDVNKTHLMEVKGSNLDRLTVELGFL